MKFRTAAAGIIILSFLTGVGLAVLTTDKNVPVYKESSLYQKILNEKDRYELKAEDAVIDSVWKKTPGISGREVDVEASYRKMKKEGSYKEDHLVYKMTRPDVSLDDLPAAPIYRGHPDKKAVSLFINVSWGEEYIPEMIDVLNKHQAKAAFFIDGAFANEFPHLIQMIEEEGHTIGSHGYGHKDMGRMSKAEAADNLKQADDILFALTKQKIEYFAPPSGSFHMETVEAADELGMETMLWTVDTIDWQKPSKDVLVTRVLNKVHNGATILMHPTQVTVDSLPQLIEGIRKKGLQISDLPKMLSEER